MVNSSGSTEYSRLKWKPRRATFSVKIDRFIIRTVNACEVATRLHASGSLWNSFVMAFRVDRVLARLRALRAELPRLKRALGHARTLAAAYDVLPAWNFSSDFLARVPEALAVVPAPDTGWDDWGTPEAVERTLAACLTKPTWWHRRPWAEAA